MRLRERLPGLMAATLLLALVIATWWAADYTQRAITLDPPRRLTHEPDAWAQRFFMLRSDPEGLAINRLEGGSLQHYPDDDSTEIFQARAIVHQSGTALMIGTADVAVLDRTGERIILRGHARVLRRPHAQTPAMQVDSNVLTLLIPEDTVTTDAPAVVVRGHSVMRGTGMVYNNKTNTLHVQSAVDVHIVQAPDEGGL